MHTETGHHHHQPTIRSAYSPRVRLAIFTPESEQPYGRTKQSFKAECDINNILSKFQRTGLLEFVNERTPQYGDVSSIDFQESMEQVRQANEMFADLPSSVRKRFHNDPTELLSFLDDPANRQEGVVLGLLSPPPVVPTGGTTEAAKPASKPV